MKKTTKWFGVMLLVLCATYWVLLLVSGAKLRRADAALEAAGRPMRVEELIPPEIPDDANGALLYERAMLGLKSVRVEYQSSFGFPVENFGIPQMMLGQEIDPSAIPFKDAETRTEYSTLDSRLLELLFRFRVVRVTPEVLDEIRTLMAMPEVEEAMALVAEAVDRPACRFNLDYASGRTMSGTELQDVQHLAYIVAGRARIRALDGAVSDAWKDLETGLRMAEDLRELPMSSGPNLALMIVTMMSDATAELCAAGLPDERLYRSLDDLLREAESANFARSFDGERLIFGGDEGFAPSPAKRQEWVDSYLYSCMSWRDRLKDTFWYRMKPLRQADHAAYLLAMKHICDIASRPIASGYEEAILEMESAIPRYAWMTRILVPGQLAFTENERAVSVATIRAARSGLAALRYRELNGDFPERLLLDDASIDPFTGEPLMYIPSEDGVVVYSVGPDLDDDGGTSSFPRARHGDIVWRFPTTGPAVHP